MKKDPEDPEESGNTNGILCDILDMEKDNSKPPTWFDLRLDLLSDVSVEELIKASQGENGEISKTAELDDLVNKGLSKKTKQKTKWAINIFSE